MFVSSQPIMAGLGGLFVFPVGQRLWSLVHLLFFISQSDCSRSYLFHFGVLSRASLFLSTAVSLHNYRDGLFFTCFRSNFKPMRSSSAIPKSPNLTESHRSLRK